MLDEARMDEILSDILHNQHPKLFQYLALMMIKGVPIDDILARVETRSGVNTLTYLTIKATLYHFQRKMEAKRGTTE